jgi:hypothetical protein
MIGTEIKMDKYGRLKTLKRVNAEYKAICRKEKSAEKRGKYLSSQDIRRLCRVEGTLFKCSSAIADEEN